MSALLEAEDLANFLGVDVSALNSARADFLLELASDLLRDELRQRIDYVAEDTIDLVGPGGSVLLLPELPAWTVDAVVETRASTDTVLLEGTDYRLELGHDHRRGIIRRLNAPGAQWPDGTNVRVTYSHGYGTGGETGANVDALPGTLKLILLRAVARGYTNATGLRQETIGRYGYTAGGSEGSLGLYFTAGDLHDLGPFYAGAGSGARS